MNKKYKSLIDYLSYFKDDKICINFIYNLRYKKGIFCPYCKGNKIYKCSEIKVNKQIYKCYPCNKKFHCLINTFFENTKLPIQKWFACIYLINTSSKGISSIQLARQAGITQKTAWTVLHKIRNSFGSIENLFQGQIEIDETYIGGKEKNKHLNKKLSDSYGGKNKQVVFGIIQRGKSKKVKAIHLKDNKTKTINKTVFDNIERGSDILADDNTSYFPLKKYYEIYTTSHNKGEYVINEIIHSNTIEGFWSILKRGYTGIYSLYE